MQEKTLFKLDKWANVILFDDSYM